MFQTSEQIDAISAALAKAFAKIENVRKDAENPHFRSHYATLAGAIEEARPKFAAEGIAILQAPINGEGSNIGVTTRLLHSSGQWIESTLYVAPTKFDAQGAGSAITYLRRYALMAMAGIAPEDDDGEAAVGRPQAAASTRGATKAAPPPRQARPANGAEPPTENPDDTASRHRVRMLIDKYDNLIKTAPSVQALNLSFEDGREELAEIEAAGDAGRAAVEALRGKFMTRIERSGAA